MVYSPRGISGARSSRKCKNNLGVSNIVYVGGITIRNLGAVLVRYGANDLGLVITVQSSVKISLTCSGYMPEFGSKSMVVLP